MHLGSIKNHLYGKVRYIWSQDGSLYEELTVGYRCKPESRLPRTAFNYS